jgi:ABC-type bacteriocin/lantibiotic exporter with double-glycine peptidase domain
VYAYFYSSDNLGEVRVLAALFAIAIFRLIPAANRILQSMMHIKMNAYTIDKLSDIKPESDSGENWIFSFNNSIELRDIHYSYPGKRKLFNGLNLIIQKGSCTGIQGPSGSGKTTLIKTILGMVNPETGGIFIDGQQVNDRDNMSGLVSYVGQDPYLFYGTVMENVVFDGKAVQADKAKVLKALEMAAFKMDGYSDDVLYLNVGELGSKLSEGQKQRLAIARAIYHASPVLIMDEPSSALDAETEYELIKQLETLKQLGKTILIIAHREKIFDICDAVYKLEYGKISQSK